MANLLWRRRRNRNKKEPLNRVMELAIPPHFCCPISLDLMKDPVSLSTGITYDRENIEKWFDSGKATCPLTNQILTTLDQTPNHVIRTMIQKWCVESKPHGVERIPTPHVPITPHEASEIRSELLKSAMAGDDSKCQELVRKVESLVKKSERDKRCFVNNEIGSSFAGVMELFARLSIEKHQSLLKEVLSALVWSFPREEEGVSKLGSRVSLRCMAWFLSGDDPRVKRDAVLVLREVMHVDRGFVDAVVGIEGVEESLVEFMKVPSCSRSTQACLVIINQMMYLRASRFVALGLVSVVLDVIIDGDTSSCEKGLGVLDSICESREGKESVGSNALTVPLMVKKILRVSEAGTGLSVSILWRIIVGGNERGVVEAVRAGAFQKLLVVLQVGCGERTKEKVSELLKVMNVCRHKLGCFDSSMGLKVP